MSVVNKTARNS